METILLASIRWTPVTKAKEMCTTQKFSRDLHAIRFMWSRHRPLHQCRHQDLVFVPIRLIMIVIRLAIQHAVPKMMEKTALPSLPCVTIMGREYLEQATAPTLQTMIATSQAGQSAAANQEEIS